MIESLLHNPVKVSVGVLLLLLFGLVALTRLPLQLTPEVQQPTLTVTTRWPGASPQEIEREIVQEQEDQLKGVEGVIKMSSECSDSQSRIVLEFNVGTDINRALLLVNSRLQQVTEYPEDADEPTISLSNSGDRPIAWMILSLQPPSEEQLRSSQREHPELQQVLQRIIQTPNKGLAMLRLREEAMTHPQLLGLLPEHVDVPGLRRFVEDSIEARFERVPGVSNSNIFGGREEELQVLIDPHKLAARGITISDLRQALQVRDRDTSAGDLWEGKRRWVVRIPSQFRSMDEVTSLVVTRRGDKPVYLRDIAEVKHGYKKPTGIVQRFGEPVLAVNCQRETGANVLEVMRGIQEVTRDLNTNLLHPRGLQLTQVYDETEYIYSALDLVRNNIFIGGTLTILILLIFLRSARSTVIIALAIPTSVIGTFLVLLLLGRSINVISLAGLAFAVGMLVDNAVVVLENIFRHYQLGKTPWQASIAGTREVWGAVIASTLTTLAVFIPVLFVQEEAGQLFRDIALAISAAVGLSLIVSISVIPCAAARLLKTNQREAWNGHTPGPVFPPGIELDQRPRRMSRLLGRFDRFGNAVRNFFLGVNGWAQASTPRQLLVVLLLVGGAFGISILLIPKVEYLPSGNRNLVFGTLLPPAGYNLPKLQQIGRRIELLLKPYWDVDFQDPDLRQAEYPAIDDFFYVSTARNVFMGLRAHDPDRARELVPLILEVAGDNPGTFVVAKQSSLFERGLSAGRTIDVEITGPELSYLSELGGRILGQVKNIMPDAQAFPRPSLDLSSPEIHVMPRWEQTADMKMDASDLGYAVNALVDGAYAADYYMEGNKIDLTIKGESQYTSRTQDLALLPITTPSGNLVPLSALAHIGIRSGPEQINRRERERAITIEVSPPASVALEDAMDRIRNEIIEPMQNSNQLNGGYQVLLSGTTDKLQATWKALRFNFILALLITYLLMAALFESWLYPFVIILTVPLGAVGGLLGLKIINLFLNPGGVYQPLDVLTMLGFVILVGTTVNNGILIVHQSLNHIRDEDMPVDRAILESVRNRVRPIFMTTATTLFGLLPLVVSPGAGSELYRGLGSVVLGGLLVATLFTLILVPTVFHLMMSLRMQLSQMIFSNRDSAGSSRIT
jgi:HAE1 family hydrophobic/amphiphilic exporter-1